MEIKGAILESRLQFVKDRFGERAVNDVLAALPAADQATLRKPLNPAGWYHFQTGQHLDDAIVKVIGKGDAHLFEEMAPLRLNSTLQAYRSSISIRAIRRALCCAPR